MTPVTVLMRVFSSDWVSSGVEAGLVSVPRGRVRHHTAGDPPGLPAGEGRLQGVPVPHQHPG